jgi:hypothetical protein
MNAWFTEKVASARILLSQIPQVVTALLNNREEPMAMDMDAVLSLQMLPAASGVLCSVSSVSCDSTVSCPSNQSKVC